MDYYLTLILLILVLTIIFLILAKLIISTFRTNKSIIKENVNFSKKEIELKSNNLDEAIDKLEQLLIPIINLTKKHENILSVPQSKGALGEQIVEEILSKLPHEWYSRNIPLPGGTVEFALRTPDKRWIPIDSQWTATDLLVKFEQATSQPERNSIRAEIHNAVYDRAKNAMRYLDKEHTLGFCIVAVPDSVFNLCAEIQAYLTSSNIVLISYNLLIPYILLIVNQYLKTAQTTESFKVSQIISRSVAEIEIIQKYIIKNVIPTLEIVGRQQTQHIKQNKDVEDVYSNLSKILEHLNELKTTVSPVPNLAISSIPLNLQRGLRHVQDGLLENFAKQSENNKDTTNS